MLFWIYKIPVWLVMPLVGIAFVGLFWLGVIFITPLVKRYIHRNSDFNDMLNDYIGYFGVIYGLLLGLLAIGAYDNFTGTGKAVANEAASLLALYRNVASYPQPYQAELKTLILHYTRETIEDAWPRQRRGIIPLPGKHNPVRGIAHKIAEFEPQTLGQQSVHQATLRQYDNFLQARLDRLFSVVSGMPAVMWYTVGIGAILNFILLWLFDLNRTNHFLLGGLISFFTGTLICLIAMLDNPYRGDVSISPHAFAMAYQQMLFD